jgi:hypothetical protein
VRLPLSPDLSLARPGSNHQVESGERHLAVAGALLHSELPGVGPDFTSKHLGDKGNDKEIFPSTNNSSVLLAGSDT